MSTQKPRVLDLEETQVYSWCACGFSQNGAFCDGSHREKAAEGTHSLRFSIEKSGQYALCMCKKTKNPPFCDGSHNQE